MLLRGQEHSKGKCRPAPVFMWLKWGKQKKPEAPLSIPSPMPDGVKLLLDVYREGYRKGRHDRIDNWLWRMTMIWFACLGAVTLAVYLSNLVYILPGGDPFGN